MTDRYGVIGHPISHSKSPVIHRLFARQTGQDISYEAWDIAPAVLEERVSALIADGVRGFNITVPHKAAMAALVQDLAPRARAAGAINTLIVNDDGSRRGDNTDGIGLVRDLRDNLGLELAGSRILVLGAGGATRGIVPALLAERPHGITVANRTVQRARSLAGELVPAGRIIPCRFDELGGQHFDLVLNATSAGLDGEVPPFPTSIIAPETVCYDLSYAMSDTPFVRWAREHGAERAWQGWGMLVEQAAESFGLWRGIRPETAPVLARLIEGIETAAPGRLSRDHAS